MTHPGMALALSVFLVLAPAGARGQEQGTAREVAALEQAMQDAIRKAEPAVACVIVSRSDVYRSRFNEPPPSSSGKLGAFHPATRSELQPPPQFGGRGRRFQPNFQPQEDDPRRYDLSDPKYVPEAFGSGIVIDGRQLLILTCHHVIKGATKIYVRLPGDKGSYADIYAAEPRSDLAVLKLIDNRVGPLPEARLGDGGAVQKGQFVVALANPFAAGFRDGSPSAARGIIANVRRRAAASGREEEKDNLYAYSTLLQTDARFDAGSSGGALINLKGEVIGLLTARAAVAGSEVAGGFAVPMDAAMKRIIDRLRQGLPVEYGFLGVSPASDTVRGEGVRIDIVTPGSPAERAGLQRGWWIAAVNGVKLNDFEDLYLAVGLLQAGSEARLEIRNHSPPIVPVTLAKFYVPAPAIAANEPPPVRGIRVDYTSVLYMKQNPPGALFFPMRQNNRIEPGVYVTDVEPGSPAAAARLQLHDVITQVNGQDVDSPAEFYRAVSAVPAGAPVELTLTSADWHRRNTTHLTIR